MFRHKGKRRTHIHNLRLASTLSLTAGIVNITGVLSFGILTTNVTGHFAYFSEEFVLNNYSVSLSFLLFILFFLLGAFTSNVLIELVSRKKPAASHALPMLIETSILVFISFYHNPQDQPFQIVSIACALLFAMGVQNSLVTQISASKVRTTHLTGLFTDLGIELSQLIFYRKPAEIQRLSGSIRLRLMIISFFFIGCVAGGFLFGIYGLKTLLFAAASLVVAMFYDTIRYQLFHIRRKVK
ncbi:YoaK family protein [Daejeonella sp. JGW-45]|uniref:YoaK family protein n=1 Tax=Daejeonella sp. JGW-45 TaxID=3034148 RepID=UPI0023ECBDAF|nr:YoaK family protein [Daejeonella sp. JGW-45]